MKAIFAHGKESGPWGSKIKTLAEIAQQHGFQVESIDYTKIKDPDLRTLHLIEYLKEQPQPCILIGSSMGGYVSLVAAQALATKALFLLAPALYMPNYKVQAYNRVTEKIEIVHGWSDDVIPVEHSIRFAQHVQCTLHLIQGDHRLNSSIEEVKQIFATFLKSLAPSDSPST